MRVGVHAQAVNPFPASFLRCLFVALLTFLPRASAMSVRAPTFPELVAESSAIVRARVVQVASRRVESPQGDLIKTFVTFEVSQSLKGTDTRKIVLAFVGGQVGLDRLEVPGMPQFQRDADEFLFISDQPGICPLVGAMHGRFRVVTDQKAGRPYIARDDRSALVHLGDVALPMHGSGIQAASIASALSPDAFAAAIAAEVAHPTANR